MTLTCSPKVPLSPPTPPDKTSTLFRQAFSLMRGHACSRLPPQVCSCCFPPLPRLLAKLFCHTAIMYSRHLPTWLGIRITLGFLKSPQCAGCPPLESWKSLWHGMRVSESFKVPSESVESQNLAVTSSLALHSCLSNLKCATVIRASVRPRFCISSKLPGSAVAAGLGTMCGITEYCTISVRVLRLPFVPVRLEMVYGKYIDKNEQLLSDMRSRGALETSGRN